MDQLDPIFEQEQKHLHDTYDKLTEIESTLSEKLSALIADASESIYNMKDEITYNLSDDGQASETSIEIETLNSLIDIYNLTNDINTEKLRNAQLLMKQPYFAEIALKFKPDAPARTIYIGAAGMTDENYRHFIVDWRSPVAEVYYNQENGPTSYKTEDRVINVDLELRRQFDIDGRNLNAYFDTTVAIEDPLLLSSLSKHRSAKMHDITMTIQREQNEVIRHEDVPVLLVNGIAGSGKTSVLLQRIAYLFYTFRETLNPSNVCLITPNPVFQKYIDNVLPDMGEENPKTLTYLELMEKLGVGNRGTDCSGDLEILETIDTRVKDLKLGTQDFADIKLDNNIVFPASQIQSIAHSFKNIPVSPRLIALVNEELRDRLESKVKSLIKSDKTHAEIADMSFEDQRKYFGHLVFPQGEEEFRELATQYLEQRYATIYDAIENTTWLRVDRIGMNLLERQHLTPTEWIYLKLAITGEGDRAVRFVMIDEVQDYTLAQLKMLDRYFNNAHFLLLGDENQAIKPHTASFAEIKELFTQSHGSVDECRLMTSYRSSPEITELFATLLDEDTRIQVSSVQREGIAPHICSCADEAAYREELLGIIKRAPKDAGLTALVAPSKKQARKIAELLSDAPAELQPQIIQDGVVLPDHGVILLELALAKGLEFDSVVVCDAQETFYPDNALSRRRLYTALSRATQEVAVVSCGPLTPLITE